MEPRMQPDGKPRPDQQGPESQGARNTGGSRAASPDPVPERVLADFPELRAPRAAPLAGGWIHRTYAVDDGDRHYILQRLNPMFSPEIQDNIAAVTDRLRERGFPTFRLIPTRLQCWICEPEPGQRWRLMSRIPGVSFARVGEPAQARAAGALVARFHSALDGLPYALRPVGIVLHDTPVHMEELRHALQEHTDHRLYGEVEPLAQRILKAYAQWTPLPAPRRIAHGDLKLNNVLFAGDSPLERTRARSLIDLDTVSRMPLHIELGDAWRSWCNRQDESAGCATLDLQVFRAAVEGYLGSCRLGLPRSELETLAHGLERVSLELASRFAADTLTESYFGWSPERFATRGDHNLARVRGQLELHDAARETRSEQAAFILG